MSLDPVIDVLMEIPMFRKVDRKRLKLIAFMGQSLTFHTGERVFEQGDDGDAAYVLLKGKVEVLVEVDGKENPVAELGARQIFGELAVLCDQPRSAAIAAKTDVTLLRLDRKMFRDLLHEFPDISLEIVKLLAHRLEATSRLLSDARGQLL